MCHENCRHFRYANAQLEKELGVNFDDASSQEQLIRTLSYNTSLVERKRGKSRGKQDKARQIDGMAVLISLQYSTYSSIVEKYNYTLMFDPLRLT